VPESASRDVYLSFFMFTANLAPLDPKYTASIIRHIAAIAEMGYAGLDLPIAPTDTLDHKAEIASYERLKTALDKAGVGDIGFTTNVGATLEFDPCSMSPEVRANALAYLKSRVDITAAFGGKIMAGPIVFPYNAFPKTAGGAGIWSDALGDWMVARYRHAQPVLDKLGDYAADRGVKIAIEPVDHWETPAPNTVADVMGFLEEVPSRAVGVCIDIAHVVLGGGGPAEFRSEVRQAAERGRLNYFHLSAPDRGALDESWIPWADFLGSALESYDGPLLVETFNAIPVFLESLRLTRRKFRIPGEDPLDPGRPDAYDVARAAIATVRREIDALDRA
jgi:D-psicose/D-tagatose/L-ribulose 3-epimerase